jgi:predicted O-methyltransferase YrrM
MVISQHISEWNWNLTTFEVSYLSYNQALKNFIKYNQMNITSYNIDPLLIDIKKIFKSRKIDFLFIDAVMKLYLDFFLKFEDLLENNCTILLDNVVKFKSKTEWLYKFLNENQIEYKIQDIKPNDGIMKIVYKK